ncbi:MAG: hypothetical protein C0473_02710 [Cyanobacteria bacterium DS3.002]|nr:hypothetical protein [Cyanobacteria bacterium DS3.002]MBA4049727.1 hypothetical protein [Cyanobacteria bacterium DS2.008]MBA4073386.1 hypothetical protein [Cyanobacteria bacterium PR.023]
MASINYLQLEIERQDLDEQCDYRSACEIQKRIVFEKEEDATSTAGDLGEAYFKLGSYLRVLNEPAQAELAYVRSLGLLRIFHGKGHEKVKAAMVQIKELRVVNGPSKTDKIDRRRAEYKRAQLSSS